MAPDGIVKPIDVAANGAVFSSAGVADGPPDELGFQGLEDFRVLTNVCAMALSQQFPLPDIATRMP